MSPEAAIFFEGIAVYYCAPYWRISHAGTILHLQRDRLTAPECGRIYAKHFGLTVRVFE